MNAVSIVKRVGDWSVESDGHQWILSHRVRDGGRSIRWRWMSFVHSTRDVLARCMCEQGVPSEVRMELLEGLPSTFAEWACGVARGVD